MISLTKKEVDEMMKLGGNIRGVIVKGHFAYIKDKKGQKGVENLEKRVKELGYPINYRNPQIADWYPVDLRVISLLLIKNTFNWSDKETKEMGNTAPKFSFIIRILTKFFISIKKIIEKFSDTWDKYYRDIGKLEGVKVDEKMGKLFYV